MKFKLKRFIYFLFLGVLTSCVLTQKKGSPSYNELSLNNSGKVKVSASSKNVFSSFYSENVDITEEKKITNPDVVKDFEDFGFEIVDQSSAEYDIVCSFNSKNSAYVPKNGQPFYFIFKYIWIHATFLSLGLIPMYHQIDYSISVNVTNSLTKLTKNYELNLSYEAWISLFLFYKNNVKSVRDTVAEKNKFEFRNILNNIKSDIDMKKI